MSKITFDTWFKQNNPDIPLPGALSVLRLAGEGSTIPFIARYRKEQTGNLNEVAIQRSIDAKVRWDEIESRKSFILQEIESQGKLSDELRAKIDTSYDLSTLEDLYLPYKKKRKTRATIAKEAGLEPLADWIWGANNGAKREGTLDAKAATFVDASKGIADTKAAIEGAQSILIERISEMADLRQYVRTELLENGFLVSAKGAKPKEHSKFEGYFDFQASLKSLLEPTNSHRYLALRRGEAEEELVVKLGGAKDDASLEEGLLRRYEAAVCTAKDSETAPPLLQAARLALRAYVMVSISSEIHTMLKQIADEAAIHVFAENIRALLLAAPFGAKTVLGVDPGLRTGCKLALIDRSSKFVANSVVHPSSKEDDAKLRVLLKNLVQNLGLQAIAIGNGTASRETERFFRTLCEELGLKVPVVVVSESGASVYSASEAAREEFPELDVTVRGAISIARRFQDPLAELVKVDPKSIGVGQYQHDVSPSALKQGLERVVESCVNAVGVNLNTASQHLLAYVSGIGPSLAKAIVEHRQQHGLFKSRAELLKVGRFGEKAFEQAAGFLRVPDGVEPLDRTGVHPERYPLIKQYAERLQKRVEELLGSGVAALKSDKTFRAQVGEFTFDDMVRELEKPGRDPRDTFVPFEFLKDVHQVKDLTVGMLCPGIVTNVTNFGAFVDIGVHQDGLVHISQLSDSFVKDPRAVVSPGDRVKVRVLEVNLEKNQIALSMKSGHEVSVHVDRGSVKGSAGGRPAKAPPPPQDEFKNNPFASLLSLKR